MSAPLSSPRAAGFACLCLLAALLLGAPRAVEAKPPGSFYGVAPQALPSGADFRRMARNDVGLVRFELRWSAIDPTPEAGYDWSEVDRIVLASARHRVKLLPFLFNTPRWVAQTLDGNQCWETCYSHAPRSPAALLEWWTFVSEVGARYGPGGELWQAHPEIRPLPIRNWEIWNEQNNPHFFRPTPDPEAYARILDLAADALRTHDPNAWIVLGGMFHPTPQDGEAETNSGYGFLQDLYDLGMRDDFDAVAIHPYAARMRGVRSQIEGFRDVMLANDDAGAATWVTEVGWSSSPPGEHPLTLGREGQAERVRNMLGYATRERRRLGLRGVVWFSWRDIGRRTGCAWCARSGLFDARHKAKPALREFRRFTQGR